MRLLSDYFFIFAEKLTTATRMVTTLPRNLQLTFKTSARRWTSCAATWQRLRKRIRRNLSTLLKKRNVFAMKTSDYSKSSSKRWNAVKLSLVICPSRNRPWSSKRNGYSTRMCLLLLPLVAAAIGPSVPEDWLVVTHAASWSAVEPANDLSNQRFRLGWIPRRQICFTTVALDRLRRASRGAAISQWFRLVSELPVAEEAWVHSTVACHRRRHLTLVATFPSAEIRPSYSRPVQWIPQCVRTKYCLPNTEKGAHKHVTYYNIYT